MARRRIVLRVEELDVRDVPSVSAATNVSGLASTPVQAAGTGTTAGMPATFGSEDALRQYLIDQAVQQYSWEFGQREQLWDGYLGPPLRVVAGIATPIPAAASFTQTNTQVQGVDEGDFVETDGLYLYILSQNRLSILDARVPNDLKVVSQTDFTGNVVAEYLNGDHLTVISQDPGRYGLFPVNMPIGWEGAERIYQITRSAVTVTVLDIADRATPMIMQRTTLDGYYSDSRAIGDSVYVAATNSFSAPAPQYTTDGDTIVYEREESYRARMEALPLNELLPHFATRWQAADGVHEKTGPLSNPDAIYQPAEAGISQLLTILQFDVSGQSAGPIHSVSLATSYYVTTLYAAPDSFYLTTSRWHDNGAWTQIDKLSLSESGMQLTATGEVPGTILNRFSVSENGNYLYIATTSGWGQSASNNIYVLAQQEQALNTVGRLENLAPGEKIYSVRFVGDLGFVSTYEQIDPLFAIDLSNPTAPKVAGQLEVTGYSDYLQMIDATHMIGIGRDVQPGAWEPDGVQVSLYDVSDPSNPTLLSRYVVYSGNWWLSSAAEHDPHALTYDADSHTLVVPLSGDGSNSQLVFNVDTASGTLALKGQFSDPSPAQSGPIFTSVYFNPVQRNVIIGNMLYTISNNMVQVHSLDDLSTVVATASLSDPASSPGPEVWELIDMPNDSGSDGGASQPLVFIDAGSVPSSSTKDQSPASTTDTTTVPLTPGPTAGLFDPSFLGGVMVG